MRLRRAAPPEEAQPAPAQPESAQPRAIRRALPPASQLRRERRALIQVREQRLRDLGGLMLEMYRRDQFRQDLLVDRCNELANLDARLNELDTLLAVTASRGRVREAARCEHCGATLFWGAKFCNQCGTPVAAA